ncbi:MAG: ABC transporter permease [Firmicutes bacterium]|nr:ABC transporter permease [Bacillota bacterium]
MNTIKEIIREHLKYRNQIWKLAKTDLGKNYKGSVLGWAWAILKPMITLTIYWFAFSIGLRSGKPVEGYPYFLWLMAGMIPWFYSRSALTGGASCLRRYTYLITKIKYPISTIPTFVNLSNFLVHLMLTAFMILLYMAFGFMPDIYYLQLPLYMMMAFLFWNFWGLCAGMLSGISRDFLNFVKSITIGFLWLSGIFYDVSKIPNEWIREVMLFNPITIIVNGFRNSLIYDQWFWENPTELRNYAIVTVVMGVLSIWIYKRLKKDIPDVL